MEIIEYMALLDIVLYPDAPLREAALPVVSFTPALKKLADDMLETMYENNGVGLAGPQVGVRKQILVLCEPDGEPMCLINPEIVEMDGRAYAEEGCLSLPEIYASVPRATRIRVRAMDLEGLALDFEARDFLARIIQHEYDHLQGKVFPERLDVMTREAVLADWDALRSQNGLSAAASVRRG